MCNRCGMTGPFGKSIKQAVGMWNQLSAIRINHDEMDRFISDEADNEIREQIESGWL